MGGCGIGKEEEQRSLLPKWGRKHVHARRRLHLRALEAAARPAGGSEQVGAFLASAPPPPLPLQRAGLLGCVLSGVCTAHRWFMTKLRLLTLAGLASSALPSSPKAAHGTPRNFPRR